ncbi:MAG: GDP-mannose 4,6-dehydratase, partial [Ginsengibacter sp.]
VINGDGQYSRDFTYIDNVVQANVKAAFSINPQAVNQVFNIAFGESTTLNNLVLLINEYLTHYDKSISEIKTNYGPARIGDIPHSVASIKKAKKILNYSPQFSISSGLKEAIDWYVTHKETLFATQ